MPDRDIELKRLTLDVEPQHVSVLLQNIGSTATEHGIDLDSLNVSSLTHRSSQTPPQIKSGGEAQEPPALSSTECFRWVFDTEAEQDIPVVTSNELRNFGNAKGLAPHQITRVGNAVLAEFRLKDNEIWAHHNPHLEPYLFEDLATRVIGIRATKVDELVRRVDNKEFKIKGLNTGGLAVLATLRDELATYPELAKQ